MRPEVPDPLLLSPGFSRDSGRALKRTSRAAGIPSYNFFGFGTGLAKLGFSRQSNRKADEGSKHPDRNAQFEYVNAKAIAAQAQQQPVISVDTKKKELIGNFKNGGAGVSKSAASRHSWRCRLRA